jgi:2-polyprenyl-3-methyl-5-hydroxy-6-metoxy-1,4-benzoquinol methylase
MRGEQGGARRPRVLVAIASYGTSNDRYLERIIREYGSMSFDIDIVVLSNIDKKPAHEGVECLVGLPAKNPWSLPFAHKKLFVDRRDRYDLFIYSEDDILITERNLRAWRKVNALLAADEIAGFLRVEFGSSGELNYPDVHAHFHWDPSSVRRRGDYTLAHFTNEHAACYVLSREQLHRALSSGGFYVPPYEKKYDLPCTAATDPYTQCGLTKLIPISHLEEFTVHHMSNRYVGKMGVTAQEFSRQTDALLQIVDGTSRPRSLVPTETRLWRVDYSKDYYEPVTEQITSLIPTSARSVLSIGCGSGATERWLAKNGLRVAAIPLDPVIAASAAADGVEMISEEAAKRAALDEGECFDCVLCLNVLHLAREPRRLLSLSHALMHERSILVVQTPNMMSLREIRYHLSGGRSALLSGYDSVGTHFSSARSVQNWCINSGFRIEKTRRVSRLRGDGMLGMTAAVSDLLPSFLSSALATSIIITATKMRADAFQIA